MADIYYIAENTVESKNDFERLAELFFHYSKQRDDFIEYFSIERKRERRNYAHEIGTPTK